MPAYQSPPSSHPFDDEQRGFALYVRLSESDARASGLGLRQMIDALTREVVSRVPAAETHALAAVERTGSTTNDAEVVWVPIDETLPADAQAVADALTVDLARHRVVDGSREIHLTYGEFALLQIFVENAGVVLSREQLRLATDETGTPNERTVDVHVHRLRAKLGGHGDLITTVHTKGYRFDARDGVVTIR